MSYLLKVFIAYNNLVHYKSIRNESILCWEHDFVQDLFKPICFYLNNTHINNITETNMLKFGDFSRFHNLWYQCNVCMAKRSNITLLIEDVKASSDNPKFTICQCF